MSSILLFKEKTSNVNNGSEVIARIVEYYKIEDIPPKTMPNGEKLTQYQVWCEKSFDLKDAKILHVGDCDLMIDQIFDLTFKRDQVTYLIITKRG